jgi:hypothetical protein
MSNSLGLAEQVVNKEFHLTNAEVGNDVLCPQLSFTSDEMIINDPYMSSCTRFKCDPYAEYGISPELAQLQKDVNALLKAIYVRDHEFAADAAMQKILVDLKINSTSTKLAIGKMTATGFVMDIAPQLIGEFILTCCKLKAEPF